MDRPTPSEPPARCFRCGRTRADHAPPKGGLPAGTAERACPGFMPPPSLNIPRLRHEPTGDREGASDDPEDQVQHPKGDD